jgi:thioredoxin 1
MANAVEITSTNFQGEVVESDVPVLIDFWAEWCGPCRAVAPAVESIAQEYAGKLKVGKIDIDAEPGLASKYGVMSIPMFVVVKDGQVVEMTAGNRSKDALVSALNLGTHAG